MTIATTDNTSPIQNEEIQEDRDYAPYRVGDAGPEVVRYELWTDMLELEMDEVGAIWLNLKSKSNKSKSKIVKHSIFYHEDGEHYFCIISGLDEDLNLIWDDYLISDYTNYINEKEATL